MHCENLTDDGSITLTLTKAERRAIERLCNGTPDAYVRNAMDPAVVTLWRYVRVDPTPVPNSRHACDGEGCGHHSHRA